MNAPDRRPFDLGRGGDVFLTDRPPSAFGIRLGGLNLNIIRRRTLLGSKGQRRDLGPPKIDIATVAVAPLVTTEGVAAMPQWTR